MTVQQAGVGQDELFASGDVHTHITTLCDGKRSVLLRIVQHPVHPAGLQTRYRRLAGRNGFDEAPGGSAAAPGRLERTCSPVLASAPTSVTAMRQPFERKAPYLEAVD